jgi:excisionase family DNA binding protein
MQRTSFEIFEKRIAFLESQLASNPAIQNPIPHIFDIDDLIAYIGNVSKPTVYRWLHFRTIPSYRVGKRVYFRRNEIDDWLKDKRRKTIAEIVIEARTKQ